ncbi:MAG TPA: M55 family metallopeptidase [Candidatus Acidoferrum sp.]|jgi:D-amino peptidase|nr:M55 family metallopeptidase [Candidatus Acidoferrum sp.]
MRKQDRWNRILGAQANTGPACKASTTADARVVYGETGNMRAVPRFSFNGKPVSEGSLNSAVAAEMHVPVVFLSGDDQAVADALANIGPIETVITKRALGFNAGVMTSPATVQRLIHDGVMRGIRHRGELHLSPPITPITLEWRFNNVTQAELVSYLPNSTRVDAYSVRFSVSTMADGYRLLSVVDLVSSASRE